MNKLEQQELKQLQELQTKSHSILLELGQISFNEIILNQKKEEAKKLLNNIQSEEKTFKEYIISKYGDIDINLETGEF
jgi:hypothetical protein